MHLCPPPSSLSARLAQMGPLCTSATYHNTSLSLENVLLPLPDQKSPSYELFLPALTCKYTITFSVCGTHAVVHVGITCRAMWVIGLDSRYLFLLSHLSYLLLLRFRVEKVKCVW